MSKFWCDAHHRTEDADLVGFNVRAGRFKDSLQFCDVGVVEFENGEFPRLVPHESDCVDILAEYVER